MLSSRKGGMNQGNQSDDHENTRHHPVDCTLTNPMAIELSVSHSTTLIDHLLTLLCRWRDQKTVEYVRNSWIRSKSWIVVVRCPNRETVPTSDALVPMKRIVRKKRAGVNETRNLCISQSVVVFLILSLFLSSFHPFGTIDHRIVVIFVVCDIYLLIVG